MVHFSLLVSAIVGTCLMTGFSYATSSLFSRNFRMPEILNDLVFSGSKSGERRISGKIKRISAWILHFFISYLLAVLIIIMSGSFHMYSNILSGVIWGFFTGVIATAGWQILFIIFDQKKIAFRVNLFRYTIHLLAAYIIFGISITLMYSMLSP